MRKILKSLQNMRDVAFGLAVWLAPLWIILAVVALGSGVIGLIVGVLLGKFAGWLLGLCIFGAIIGFCSWWVFVREEPAVRCF